MWFSRRGGTPQTQQDKRLLAHELSHVLQQSQAAERPALVQRRAKGSDGGPSNLSASIPDIGAAVTASAARCYREAHAAAARLR
jgi:hypothetical protein